VKGANVQGFNRFMGDRGSRSVTDLLSRSETDLLSNRTPSIRTPVWSGMLSADWRSNRGVSERMSESS